MSYGKYEYCGYCRYCICDNASADIMNGKFRCDRERQWVFADARPLKNNCFWSVVSYNLSGRDEAIRQSKNYRGFYITTYIFKSLGLSDSKDLDTLYKFKNTYLEASYMGQRFLEDYEVFGPRIARMLEASDTDRIITNRIYNFYIMGVLNCINNNRLYEGLELYKAMYNNLKELYIKPMINKPCIYTI